MQEDEVLALAEEKPHDVGLLTSAAAGLASAAGGPWFVAGDAQACFDAPAEVAGVAAVAGCSLRMLVFAGAGLLLATAGMP